MWPIKDLGGAAPNAKARINEPNVKTTYTAPYTASTTTFSPANGETFVVESLVKIPQLVVDLTGGRTSAVSTGLVVESLDVGTGGLISIQGDRGVVFDGCLLGSFAATVPITNLATLGCQFAAAITLPGQSLTLVSCYSKGVVLTLVGAGQLSITRHMCQGNASMRISSWGRGGFTSSGGGISISAIGAWDNNASYPIQILDRAYMTATATLWGNGNTGGTTAAILMVHGASLEYGANSTALPASYFYMLTASSGAESGAFIALFGNAGATRPSAPAYDDTANAFTAKRLLSSTLLSTTVALGGFGGYFFDPVTATSMGQN